MQICRDSQIRIDFTKCVLQSAAVHSDDWIVHISMCYQTNGYEEEENCEDDSCELR